MCLRTLRSVLPLRLLNKQEARVHATMLKVPGCERFSMPSCMHVRAYTAQALTTYGSRCRPTTASLGDTLEGRHRQELEQKTTEGTSIPWLVSFTNSLCLLSSRTPPTQKPAQSTHPRRTSLAGKPAAQHHHHASPDVTQNFRQTLQYYLKCVRCSVTNCR